MSWVWAIYEMKKASHFCWWIVGQFTHPIHWKWRWNKNNHLLIECFGLSRVFRPLWSLHSTIEFVNWVWYYVLWRCEVFFQSISVSSFDYEPMDYSLAIWECFHWQQNHKKYCGNRINAWLFHIFLFSHSFSCFRFSTPHFASYSFICSQSIN